MKVKSQNVFCLGKRTCPGQLAYAPGSEQGALWHPLLQVPGVGSEHQLSKIVSSRGGAGWVGEVGSVSALQLPGPLQTCMGSGGGASHSYY